MGRIDRLAEQYGRHIGLPWQKDLAGAQRAIFIVYDKTDERRLRTRIGNFELLTIKAHRRWLPCDVTGAFADWMASTCYRDSYFEFPEDLQLKLEEEFLEHVAGRVREVLTAPDADDRSVTAVYGVASLFGFVRVSDLMNAIEPDVRGRIAVFFPGEYEDSNYRLLDARDGWNYLAVPITVQDEG